jgi:hypothetical protein
MGDMWHSKNHVARTSINSSRDVRLFRLPEKPWLKVPFADLLQEKNIVHWLKKYSL